MRNIFITLLITFGLIMPVKDLSAKRQPAGMLVEVSGSVEYSKKVKNGGKFDEINSFTTSIWSVSAMEVPSNFLIRKPMKLQL